jgi:hypothetical protein
MRKNLITDYSRGELSPLLEGRFDLEFYKQGYSFGENIIPLTPAGFSIRPGTYHYGETLDSTDYTRIIPKIHKTGGGLIIEMGDGFARVWEDGVLVRTNSSEHQKYEFTVAGTIPSATTPVDGEITNSPELFKYGSYMEDLIVTAGNGQVQFDWTERPNATAEYNLQEFSININDTRYDIPIGVETLTVTGLTNGVNYPSIISSIARTDEVRKMYTGIAEEYLADMTWAQDDGAIQFASHYFLPVGLNLESAFNPSGISDYWGFSEVLFNAQTWTQYEQVYAQEYRVWLGIYYECIKTLDGTISENEPSTEPGYWLNRGTTRPDGVKPFGLTSGDYPRVVTIHEGRRVYANTILNPNTVWGSYAGDHEIYVLGPGDAQPWEHDLSGSSGSSIHWMVSTDNGITAGTTTGEWKIQGGSLGITPATIQIRRLTEFGSSSIGARLMGSQIYFFGNSGEDLYSYFFQERAAAYQSIKVSEVAEHILADDYYTDFQDVTQYGGGGVKEFSYQNDPQKIFWMIKNSGQLIGMNISNNGVAWHKHTTKVGQFQSVATIPGSDFDEVWFIVKREIDSVTKYFIEKMGDLNIHQDVDDYHLVDCGITIQADQTPDLTHLDGEEVAVSIMGKHTAVKTVESNTVDILEDYPGAAVSTSSLYYLNAATAHIGLFTEARIRTMRQGFPTTSISPGSVTLRLYKSFGGSIGQGIKPESLQPLDYPTVPGNNDISSPYETLDIDNDEQSLTAYKNLYSGERSVDYIGDWDPSGYLWIVQDVPAPFVVLGMYTDMEDGE